MFQRLMLVVAAAGVLGLSACSAYGPTPYQPAVAGEGGYNETRIESDRYRVAFKGNSLTEKETVENYLLYRAAELTLQNGFDNFTIVNRDTDKSSQIQQYGGYPYGRLSYAYFHPRYGWLNAYDPFWTPTSFREVTRYEAFAEIRFGKGPKSGDPNAFDAAEVSKNLASAITRPPQ